MAYKVIKCIFLLINHSYSQHAESENYSSIDSMSAKQLLSFEVQIIKFEKGIRKLFLHRFFLSFFAIDNKIWLRELTIIGKNLSIMNYTTFKVQESLSCLIYKN